MSKKIALILAIVLLIVIAMIVLGAIGANMPFESINREVFLVKNLFLGFIKIAPLLLVFGTISLLAKEFKNG